MRVNREHVEAEFRDYVSAYDMSDGKIALKAEHTFRVAALCDNIAVSAGLDDADREVAWLCGMLHDIGRFEQVRHWGTFYDSESVNHAEFGADLLFKDGLIGRFVEEGNLTAGNDLGVNGIDGSSYRGDLGDRGGCGGCKVFGDGCKQQGADVALDCGCDPAIEIAIRNHNRLCIEDGLDPRTQKFCDILRDADKIDILRVNVERPATEIYGATLEEIMATGISPGVEADFYACRCVNRSHMKTLLDRRIGHFAFTFELVFPYSLREMKEQGYLAQALACKSSDPTTEDKLVDMRSFMNKWLAARV